MRTRNALVFVLVIGGVLLAACSSGSKQSASTTSVKGSPSCFPNADACVRLNQVQVLGSHNSYHFQGEPAIFNAIKAFDASLAESIEYSHPVLPTQFSREGVRQIELDVFADPEGGRYAKPKLRSLLQHLDTSLPGMTKPGFKVLHAQDVDYNSNCITFVDCLVAVRKW